MDKYLKSNFIFKYIRFKCKITDLIINSVSKRGKKKTALLINIASIIFTIIIGTIPLLLIKNITRIEAIVSAFSLLLITLYNIISHCKILSMINNNFPSYIIKSK